MASTMSFVKWRGCEVVKRTRLMPLTSPTAARSSAKLRLAAWVDIAVDVLAEELDLGVALSGDALSFGEDGCRCARALLAARVGNDAVGAELVAAFDDGDVAAVRVGARGELGVEGLVGLAVVEAGDAGLAGFEAREHLGQIAIAGRARDHRDIGRALEDLVAFLLGDAADDGELLAFALHFFVLVQPVEDLLLGLVADGAGVVEDEAGVGFVGHLAVALVLTRCRRLFRSRGRSSGSRRFRCRTSSWSATSIGGVPPHPGKVCK